MPNTLEAPEQETEKRITFSGQVLSFLSFLRMLVQLDRALPRMFSDDWRSKYYESVNMLLYLIALREFSLNNTQNEEFNRQIIENLFDLVDYFGVSFIGHHPHEYFGGYGRIGYSINFHMGSGRNQSLEESIQSILLSGEDHSSEALTTRVIYITSEEFSSIFGMQVPRDNNGETGYQINQIISDRVSRNGSYFFIVNPPIGINDLKNDNKLRAIFATIGTNNYLGQNNVTLYVPVILEGYVILYEYRRGCASLMPITSNVPFQDICVALIRQGYSFSTTNPGFNDEPIRIRELGSVISRNPVNDTYTTEERIQALERRIAKICSRIAILSNPQNMMIQIEIDDSKEDPSRLIRLPCPRIFFIFNRQLPPLDDNTINISIPEEETDPLRLIIKTFHSRKPETTEVNIKAKIERGMGEYTIYCKILTKKDGSIDEINFYYDIDVPIDILEFLISSIKIQRQISGNPNSQTRDERTTRARTSVPQSQRLDVIKKAASKLGNNVDTSDIQLIESLIDLLMNPKNNSSPEYLGVQRRSLLTRSGISANHLAILIARMFVGDESPNSGNVFVDPQWYYEIREPVLSTYYQLTPSEIGQSNILLLSSDVIGDLDALYEQHYNDLRSRIHECIQRARNNPREKFCVIVDQTIHPREIDWYFGGANAADLPNNFLLITTTSLTKHQLGREMYFYGFLSMYGKTDNQEQGNPLLMNYEDLDRLRSLSCGQLTQRALKRIPTLAFGTITRHVEKISEVCKKIKNEFAESFSKLGITLVEMPHCVLLCIDERDDEKYKEKLSCLLEAIQGVSQSSNEVFCAGSFYLEYTAYTTISVRLHGRSTTAIRISPGIFSDYDKLNDFFNQLLESLKKEPTGDGDARSIRSIITSNLPNI